MGEEKQQTTGIPVVGTEEEEIDENSPLLYDPTGDLVHGEYLTTEWRRKDIITEGKLNKMEKTLSYLVSATALLSMESGGIIEDVIELDVEVAERKAMDEIIMDAMITFESCSDTNEYDDIIL